MYKYLYKNYIHANYNSNLISNIKKILGLVFFSPIGEKKTVFCKKIIIGIKKTSEKKNDNFKKNYF